MNVNYDSGSRIEPLIVVAVVMAAADSSLKFAWRSSASDVDVGKNNLSIFFHLVSSFLIRNCNPSSSHECR